MKLNLNEVKTIGEGENTVSVKAVPMSSGGLVMVQVGEETVALSRYYAAALAEALVAARGALVRDDDDSRQG